MELNVVRYVIKSCRIVGIIKNQWEMDNINIYMRSRKRWN